MVETLTTGGYAIKVLGYCSQPSERLLRLFDQGGAAKVQALDGEFVVVLSNEVETYLITSSYGVCNYYYTLHNGGFFHGDTVLDVLRQSRQGWKWNWKALADLIHMSHVLEHDTLHPNVHRVPAAAVLHYKDGSLSVSRTAWDELHPPQPSDYASALQAFNDETLRWQTPDSVVSMSGGFDSRVILSSLLKNGCKPALLTMGTERSTDAVISRQIAQDLGLELTSVVPMPPDYLANGREISRLTNGTKTADHWHTYIYPLKAKLDPSTPFFVGSNGEFARNFYLDKGLLSLLADLAPATPTLRRFWRAKMTLKPVLRPADLPSLNPELAKEFSNEALEARAARFASLCPGGVMKGLQRFYLEQRVRNFIANGLKLYSAHSAWRAPMLNRAWCTAVWNLPPRKMLGSNWHRYAMAQNHPHLLAFEEEGTGHNMSASAPPLYWMKRKRKKVPVVAYAHYNQWYGKGELHDHLRAQAPALAELIEPRQVEAILDEHARTSTRVPMLGFLTAMSFWTANVREAVRA